MLIPFVIAEFVTFIAVLYFVWRISKKPKNRIRTIVYGWGLLFLWAVLWAIIFPFVILKGAMDYQTIAKTFPEGTFVLAGFFGGWFYPLIIVIIRDAMFRKSPPPINLDTIKK